MRRPLQAFAAVLLVLALLVARDALSLKYYSRLGPGPGFFPFWLALALAGLAAALLCQASFGRAADRPEDFAPTRGGWLRLGATVAAVAAPVALMSALGFRLTMLLFYLALLTALTRQSRLLTLAIAGLGSFGVYHLFVRWLGVPLPVGWLGF